ncbi:MAG: hypothetical protein RBR36_04565 [Bacilli bacterium]|jgi:hypothetical protein|nr:hypothetical protein [Bacilli bacterium]
MADWLRILIAVAILGGLIALLIISYILNKRTKKPEGCIEIDEHCASCNIEGCAVRSVAVEIERAQGEDEK